jgi:hypothetical protein
MAEILSTLSSDGKGTPTNGGANYTLISTWESAQQQDLVAGGNTAVLECYWDWNPLTDNNVSIADWTTGPSNGITIRPGTDVDGDFGPSFHAGDPGAGFRWRNTAGTSSRCVTVSNAHVTIENIRMWTDQSSNATACIDAQADSVTIRNILMLTNNTGSAQTGRSCVVSGDVDNLVVENCVFHAIGGSSGLACDFRNISAAKRADVANCTVVGEWRNTNQVRIDTGLGSIINCAVHSDDITNGGGSVTIPNGTAQTNVTRADDALATTDFVDYANSDFNPAVGGKLDGVGTDLSGTFTDDATGGARNVPWEVGAYDIIQAAALTFSLSPDSSPLPAGLSVNATTGNIEGTPTESGTFPNIIIRGSE